VTYARTSSKARNRTNILKYFDFRLIKSTTFGLQHGIRQAPWEIPSVAASLAGIARHHRSFAHGSRDSFASAQTTASAQIFVQCSMGAVMARMYVYASYAFLFAVVAAMWAMR
jgi:hypothetical protein